MPRNHGDVSFTQSDVTGTATGIIYGDVNYIHNEGNAALTVNETSEERQKELEARWKESGTCEWLKETKQEFSTWINMENKYCFLWIHGLRGCGKTTLMSRVIAHVREQRCNTDPENIHLLFFYIGYGNDSQKKNTYRNMLMAFWDQAVKGQYARASEVFGSQSADDDIQNALNGFLAKSKRDVYIIVDALDQLPSTEHRNLLRGLDSIIQKHRDQNKFHIAVAISSRDCFGYERLEKHKRLLIQIRANDNAADIRKYVNMKLGSYIFDDNPELKEQALTELINKADGMFLWAKLQTANMCDIDSEEDVKNALEKLVPPGEMETMYGEYAIRFEKTKGKQTPNRIALRTMALLAHTGGSMPKETMLVALALDMEHGRTNPTTYKEIRTQPAKIIRWCKHLIDINENLGVIRFCHGSVYEYFEKYQPHTAHNRIAQLCLAHICSSNFSTGPYKDANWYNYGSLRSLLKDNPFLEFSSHNWATSMKKSVQPGTKPKRFQSSHAELLGILKKLFQNNEAKNLQLAFQVYLLAIGKSMPGGVCFEHIISYFGLIGFLEVFQNNGWLDLKKSDNEGSTAIHWALRSDAEANNGRTETELVVRKLIKYGSDINKQDHKGRTPLYYASHGGNLPAVGLLLEHNAALNVQSEDYETALIAASRRDHHDIVEKLLKAGADVRIQGFLGTALQAVSLVGCTRCAKGILDKYDTEPITEKRGPFGTSLHVAAFYGHLEILKLLLETGKFDVRATNKSYGSVLTAAATGCNLLMEPRPYEGIFRELILHRVDVNDTSGAYGPAVRATAACGDKRLIKILLEAGADISRAKGGMGTAYQAAVEGGHVEIQKLLLDKDPNAASYAERDPPDGEAMLYRLRQELFRIALVASNMAIINNLIGQVEKLFHTEIAKGETELLKRLANLSEEVFTDVVSIATRTNARATARGKSKAPKEQDIPEEGIQEDMPRLSLQEKEPELYKMQDQAGNHPAMPETAPCGLVPEGATQESKPKQDLASQTSSTDPLRDQASLDVVQQCTPTLEVSDEHTQKELPKEESPNCETEPTADQPQMNMEECNVYKELFRSLFSRLCRADTSANDGDAPTKEVSVGPRASVSRPPATQRQHIPWSANVQDQNPLSSTTSQRDIATSPAIQHTEQRQLVSEPVSPSGGTRPEESTESGNPSSSANIKVATEPLQSMLESETAITQEQSPPSLSRRSSMISILSRRSTYSVNIFNLRRQTSSFGRDILDGRFPEVLDRLTRAAVDILAYALDDESRNDSVVELIADTWIDALQNLLSCTGFGEPMLQRVVWNRTLELKKHLIDTTLTETARFERAHSLAKVGVQLLMTAISRKARCRRLSFVLSNMWVSAVNGVEALGASGQEPVQRLVKIFAAKFTDAIKTNDLVQADTMGDTGLEILRAAALSETKSLMNKFVEEWVGQWQFAIENEKDWLPKNLVNHRLKEYQKHIKKGEYDEALGLAIGGIGLLRAAMEQRNKDVVDAFLPIILSGFKETIATFDRNGSIAHDTVQAEEHLLPAEENKLEQSNEYRRQTTYMNMNVIGSVFEEIVRLFNVAETQDSKIVNILSLVVLRRVELLPNNIREALMELVLRRVERARHMEFQNERRWISTTVLCLLNVVQSSVDEWPKAVRALEDLTQKLPSLTNRRDLTQYTEAINFIKSQRSRVKTVTAGRK